MSKRVFFSFHSQDLADWRIQVVRNQWLSRPEHEDGGLFDEPTWDESSMSGQAAIKRLISSGLEHTSVTCVLIGTHTWSRRWVRYEIVESLQRGNRVVAVHVNGIPDRARKTKPLGRNPLELLALSVAPEGSSVQVLQYANGAWLSADDSKGWSLTKPVPLQKRGKRLQLSSMYKAYDWVADNGPENLDRWLGG